MIYGLGIDICENHRVRKIYTAYGDKFLERVFLPEEAAYCKTKCDPVPHLAARFAMKEAFIKALGTGNVSSYREVGLLGDEGRKDPVVFGEIKNTLEKLGIKNIFCSISHADAYSTAVVVLEK